MIVAVVVVVRVVKLVRLVRWLLHLILCGGAISSALVAALFTVSDFGNISRELLVAF